MICLNNLLDSELLLYVDNKPDATELEKLLADKLNTLILYKQQYASQEKVIDSRVERLEERLDAAISLLEAIEKEVPKTPNKNTLGYKLRCLIANSNVDF